MLLSDVLRKGWLNYIAEPDSWLKDLRKKTGQVYASLVSLLTISLKVRRFTVRL